MNITILKRIEVSDHNRGVSGEVWNVERSDVEPNENSKQWGYYYDDEIQFGFESAEFATAALIRKMYGEPVYP